MQLISFRDVVHMGEPLCDCLIKGKVTLEEALKIYCKVLTSVKKSVELDQVRLKELGIDNSCKLTYENLLTEIINSLITADINIGNQIGLITKQVSNMLNSVQNAHDELVKASSTDTAGGFLNAKITTNQPGSISYQSDKLILTGFVPIGAVMFINKSRLADFDSSGKGKVGTDVFGWAIGNGSNGTTNRLGSFPRFTDDVLNAGKKEGSNEFTLTAANIPGFDMTVSGNINDSLLSPIQLSIKYNTTAMGTAGDRVEALLYGNGSTGKEMKSVAVYVTHKHSFDLKASRVNTPAKVSLVPDHVKEIPIERIPI